MVAFRRDSASARGHLNALEVVESVVAGTVGTGNHQACAKTGNERLAQRDVLLLWS